MELEKVKSLLYGHAIGDALGLPVEFAARDELAKDPVVDMRGFGTFEMRPGTWSDDTSMTLALMESISRIGKCDYADIMTNFLHWVEDDEFSYDGTFDVGAGTFAAIKKFSKGTLPLLCGGRDESSNGNGSLMRISPMIFYLDDKFHDEILTDRVMTIIHNVSSLTHAHNRSKIACGIYVLIGIEILHGSDLKTAIKTGIQKADEYYSSKEDYKQEMQDKFADILRDDFADFPEDEIKSDGYVVHSLEAALWCLLNTTDYKSCVLKAVNLGGDTDTIGAIAGGLAGLAYGFDSIPSEWVETLLGKSTIDYMIETFASKTYKQ